VHLLRGTTEWDTCSFALGFEAEVAERYRDKEPILNSVSEVFNSLPLAAVIDSKIFAVHSGLVQGLDRVGQIQLLDRVASIYKDLYSLLWAEPQEPDGAAEWGWVGRGIPSFSSSVSARFLAQNSLNFIVRSAGLMDEGFQWMHKGNVLTFFSVANYAYRCANKGAIVVIGADLQPEVITFTAVEEWPEKKIPRGPRRCAV